MSVSVSVTDPEREADAQQREEQRREYATLTRAQRLHRVVRNFDRPSVRALLKAMALHCPVSIAAIISASATSVSTSNSTSGGSGVATVSGGVAGSVAGSGLTALADREGVLLCVCVLFS